MFRGSADTVFAHTARQYWNPGTGMDIELSAGLGLSFRGAADLTMGEAGTWGFIPSDLLQLSLERELFPNPIFSHQGTCFHPRSLASLVFCLLKSVPLYPACRASWHYVNTHTCDTIGLVRLNMLCVISNPPHRQMTKLGMDWHTPSTIYCEVWNHTVEQFGLRSTAGLATRSRPAW